MRIVFCWVGAIGKLPVIGHTVEIRITRAIRPAWRGKRSGPVRRIIGVRRRDEALERCTGSIRGGGPRGLVVVSHIVDGDVTETVGVRCSRSLQPQALAAVLQ